MFLFTHHAFGRPDAGLTPSRLVGPSFLVLNVYVPRAVRSGTSVSGLCILNSQLYGFGRQHVGVWSRT